MLAPSPSFPAPPEETVSRGIAICNRTELGLATVLVRKDLTSALTRRVHEHLGLELPQGPTRSSAGPVSFAAIGPAAWLASCEGGHSTFANSLFATLGDLAAVADQSDGYAVLRLSGARVRMLLSKLVPLDLDARAFEPGHVATTVAAHIGVILWRLEDSGGSSPQFEVAVRRSFAHCFWHALFTSALSP